MMLNRCEAMNANDAKIGSVRIYFAFLASGSSSNVRQKPHEPRTLHRLREATLMLGACSRVPWVYDLRVARNKAPKQFGLFIIYFVKVL